MVQNKASRVTCHVCMSNRTCQCCCSQHPTTPPPHHPTTPHPTTPPPHHPTPPPHHPTTPPPHHPTTPPPHHHPAFENGGLESEVHRGRGLEEGPREGREGRREAKGRGKREGRREREEGGSQRDGNGLEKKKQTQPDKIGCKPTQVNGVICRDRWRDLA